jgi:hypothetical protein
MSKKEWGNAAWYLFHTLAAKLKPEHSTHAVELYSKIYEICSNLPCPECSTHAVATLGKINPKNIRTREDLIQLLWKFHNNVNTRIKKQSITMEECNQLYSRANTRNIILNFLHVMNAQSPSEKLMLFSLHKNICVNNFRDYINKNFSKYNL